MEKRMVVLVLLTLLTLLTLLARVANPLILTYFKVRSPLCRSKKGATIQIKRHPISWTSNRMSRKDAESQKKTNGLCDFRKRSPSINVWTCTSTQTDRGRWLFLAGSTSPLFYSERSRIKDFLRQYTCTSILSVYSAENHLDRFSLEIGRRPPATWRLPVVPLAFHPPRTSNRFVTDSPTILSCISPVRMINRFRTEAEIL